MVALSMVVDAAMGKLDALLKREFALPSGDRHNVLFLQAELGSMRAGPGIRHCESIDEPDAQMMDWVNLVRELAYDVEDWVDLFAIRADAAAPFRYQGWFRSSTARKMTTFPTRRAISSELQELKERLMEITERQRRRYKFGDATSTLPADHLCFITPNSLPYRYIDKLVGLARPVEEVTKMVTGSGDKSDLKTVSIVGMAGSGKTTLAIAVHKRLREENCFQFDAFFTVGQKPDLKKTLMHLLRMRDNVHHQLYEDIQSIICRLRYILKEKRYLIVVDDLWTEECWQIIKCCFPDNSLGSRIITTTRKAALAAECSSSSSDCIYDIGLLSEVDSKKLLLNRAFGSEHDYPQHLEDVFPKIIKRCGGLPLALLTVASILLEHRYSIIEWDRLIARSWLSCRGAEAIVSIVNLSYSDLPLHLRTCLLYLSTFPGNKKVDRDRLVRRWIAEGFILKKHGASVEETARTYLDELISVNMVEPLLLNKDGVRCCRLHPVIHDFLVYKSMGENFITIVDAEQQDAPSNDSVIRRLCLRSSSMQDQDLARNMNLSHARSIIVIGQASTAPHLTDLRVVRVLDLEGYDGMVSLDVLDKLLLLRYLSLRGTNVSVLPETIGELRCLETLDVRSTKVKELPQSIVRLQHLETLLVSGGQMISSIETATSRIPEHMCDRHLPEKLAAVDLRELPASTVNALGGLDQLRVLEISWSSQQCTEDTDCEALLSSMKKWSQLNSLTIHCGLGCSMEFLSSLSQPPELLEKFKVRNGGFVSVPKWIQRLNSLYFVQINVCKLVPDDLNILRALPKLQLLILGLDFVPREAILIETEGFNELWGFSVNCPAPWLTFDTGAMPKLTHLQLEFCSGSATKQSVPYGIGNLQRLTDVALLYNQEWCGNSSSVIRAVDAVKRQVAKHGNLINLTINNTKVDVVQEVDAEAERATEIQGGINVPVQQVCEEMVRTTVVTPVETCDEIVEVEGDNINDA